VSTSKEELTTNDNIVVGRTWELAGIMIECPQRDWYEHENEAKVGESSVLHAASRWSCYEVLVPYGFMYLSDG